ncbi:hypothetical protein HHI36_008894 [Cryptolaemus montrouzieri]|uniref:BED-type domain-containing protein n=1 Tax=Cryptolaemus montrouzieri TaxID=559131 RepID=A0ABD2MTP0_9CUCU
MAETPRKKRSSLWNVFNDCGEGRASCKICEQKLSYKSSTTNLKKHLDRKHQNIIITSESISPNIVLEIEGKGDKNTKTEDIETSDYSRVNNSSKSNSPVKSETLYLVMESDSSPTTDKTSLREHRVQKSKPTRYNVPSSKIVSEENSNFLETEKIVSAVEKLDNISKRVASFDSSSEKQDSFDHFGKYISSVLRDLPRSKAFSLQADIVSMVMKTTSEPPAEEKPS